MNVNKVYTSYIAITILVLIAGSCQQKQKEVAYGAEIDHIADKEGLTYLKEVLWPQAYREQDTVLLDRILDDSFKMIDNEGKYYTKKDELAWIKEHATQHDSFFYEINRLDIYLNGTAVVSGTGHIYNDSTYAIYQSSNILVKRDTLWKAISSHVSGYRDIN